MNPLTGNIIRTKAYHTNENGGLSEYMIHMDNHTLYKSELKNLKSLVNETSKLAKINETKESSALLSPTEPN